MSTHKENQVAVYIDYENIELSCQNRLSPDEDMDWSRVLDVAVSLGRVVVRRAYADWHYYSQHQRELLGMGIDLVHVSTRSGKNAADIRIVIDAMEMLLGSHEHITHVLLVSGDGDFTELVHRLRAKGKYVVGLGVSESSAEYLINACDQFIFYDLVLKGGTTPTSKKGADNGETAVAFDITEARQLIRRALAGKEEEWVSSTQVKDAMLRFNPAFNERNYGYDTFKRFLEDQTDIVRLRTNDENSQPEVALIPASDEPTTQDRSPEALLDRYLQYLSQQKVNMTPTEYRPSIILKFYEIYQENPDQSLTTLKEMLHRYFEENAPHIKGQYVHETIHQLFRTYCFEFEQDDTKYTPDTRLWDRKVSLVDDITSKKMLLTKCDRGLLQKIGQRLNNYDAINREAAARLLYGSVRGQKMLDHVEGLIEDLKQHGGERRPTGMVMG